MKKISMLFVLAMLSASNAFAEFNLQEMQEVEGLALNDFSRENGDHAQHLTGWKTWKSGEGVKVKIYITHDGMNMEQNYDCHKHGDGKLQCHAQ